MHLAEPRFAVEYSQHSPAPMKILGIVVRVLLCLLLVMPVLGTLGVFPPPTADLYTPQGWAMMSALMNSGYMMPLLGLSFALVLALILLKRSALAAVILVPLTVNVMAFHLFLDAFPISGSSVMGYVLLVCNVYLLWEQRAKYAPLLK